MTDAGIGFMLAVLCSVSFGAYILPRKLSRLSVLDYQYWVALAIAPAMLITCVSVRSPVLVSPVLALVGIGCGVLWTCGSISYSAAVDNLGVTRSTPIKNLAPAFAALYGIAIFHEYVISEPRELWMTIGGVAFMVVAALMIGGVSANEHESALAFDAARNVELRKKSFKLGLLYSAGAAFFYGAYSVPLKWLFKHGVGAFTACAWLGVGVLLSTVAVHVVKQKRVLPKNPGKREIGLGAAAGGIWTSGQLLGALAMLYIPMSISWPVSNLGTLVAIAWGVLIFKEVHLKRHGLVLAGSVVVYVAGLMLLAMAAPAGNV